MEFKRTPRALRSWKNNADSTVGFLSGDRTVRCLRSDCSLKTEANQTIQCLIGPSSSLFIEPSYVLDRTIDVLWTTQLGKIETAIMFSLELGFERFKSQIKA